MTPAPGEEYAGVERPLAVMSSALVLTFVPIYHLLDVFIHDVPPELLRLHGLWRLLPILIAIATLVACARSRNRLTHHALLVALAVSVMAMVFGLFSVNLVDASGHPSMMARGIIICTFATSLVAIAGAKELLLIFGLPFLGALAWIANQSVNLQPLTGQLIDVLIALFIASIISEVFFRIRAHQFELHRKLRRQAGTDALTGLANRRIFEDRLRKEESRSRRHGDPVSVVIGDLDHFKRVNDQFGHSVGDDVLRAVGERLSGALRTEDLAVRWGGEEFLLLLPQTGLDGAKRVAEKIRNAVAERPIRCSEGEVPVTISFGVAQLEDDEAVSELVRRADSAMYRAKSQGRNRVSC